MTDEIPENFDGFITPEGEIVSIEDADRIFSLITGSTENKDEIVQMLHGFADACFEQDRLSAGCVYLEKVLSIVEEPGEKAGFLLKLGQAREHSSDFRAALEAYSRAFDLPQEPNETWYFLNNNLAYCLNKEQRYKEGEKHCRAAIQINRDRHNAHKNLGIALEGLGRYVEAVESLVRATVLCPADGRALGQLEHLIAQHAEILEENPDILAWLHDCHEAVQSAKGNLSPPIH